MNPVAKFGLICAVALGPPALGAAGARGRLLVADTGNDRIAVYEVQGTKGRLVESWTEGLRSPEGPGLFNHPEGVAVGCASLWVSDTRNGRIVRYGVTGLCP